MNNEFEIPHPNSKSIMHSMPFQERTEAKNWKKHKLKNENYPISFLAMV